MKKPVMIIITAVFLAVTCFFVYRAYTNEEDSAYFIYEGTIIKSEYPLVEKQAEYAASLYKTIYDKHLEGMNVYLSIIPDKAYFAAESRHATMDYSELVGIMREGFEAAEYIDIFGLLTLDDYYTTDSHWKQENIIPVAQEILASMGAEVCSPHDYTASDAIEFYGAYYEEVSRKVGADELIYLTSVYTEASVLTGYEFEGEKPLYTTDREGYDVFLNGAQAILEINCPNAKSDKELVIFRDSFGSSIAPLFTGTYSKIKIVDLRYFNSHLLDEFIEFENQDVLFLSSTSLLNSGMLMK